MYYAFFDTGNEKCFSGIADAFCSFAVQFIIDNYAASLQKNDMVGMERLVQALETNGKMLAPLSCALFSKYNHLHCDNQKCMDNHKVVLTSNQLDRFEISMTRAYRNCLRKVSTTQMRFNLQRMFHSYSVVNMQTLKRINIPDKIKDHSDHLYSFIKQTNRLQNEADGFVYVRAKPKSDYNYFKNNTKLLNVIPCDCFR